MEYDSEMFGGAKRRGSKRGSKKGSKLSSVIDVFGQIGTKYLPTKCGKILGPLTLVGSEVPKGTVKYFRLSPPFPWAHQAQGKGQTGQKYFPG